MSSRLYAPLRHIIVCIGTDYNKFDPCSANCKVCYIVSQRIPERIVEKAVWGMLPKGRLGKEIFHHLKVFKGSDHPHAAQQPMDITGNINAKAGKAR